MKRTRDDVDSTDESVSSSKKRPNENDAWNIAETLSKISGLEPRICRNLCRLFDEGCSIPFIARYRRQVTEDMNPDQLRDFQEQFETLNDVKQKGEKLLKKLTESNQLNQTLKNAIKNAVSMEEIELISAPFKTKTGNQTLAARARSLGLEPTALSILNGEGSVNALSSLINPNEESLSTLDKITEGVVHIIADHLVHTKDATELINDFVNCGSVLLESKAKKGSASKNTTNESSVFKNYHDFSIPVRAIKPHQVLAINRGEKKKELTVRLVLPDFMASKFENLFVKLFKLNGADQSRQQLIRRAVQDGFKRLVGPLIQRRVRSNLNRNAEKASLDVFSENLRNLLLTPPCKGSVILSIDPGFKHGCKIAIISPSGDVLETGIIFPSFGNVKSGSQDKNKLAKLISNFHVELISLGNGHGCREVEKWLTEVLKELPQSVAYTIVTEDGASIYSCSPEAKAENPGLDPLQISAVSIARRLQDPLSEFVKIGPKHIGVGMYQHDLTEAKLKKALKEVLIECVSFVGLDVNTAPLHLLCNVSGISETMAKNIIQFREKNGPFRSRQQLKKVKGIGEKVFEQCAGFVRITNSDITHSSSGKVKPKKKESDNVYNPLDATLVHPESYDLAENIIKKENFTLEQVGTAKFLEHFRRLNVEGVTAKIVDDSNISAVPQILEALRMDLSADIRDERCRPTFRRDILSVDSLTPGLVVSGVVRNVTHFGAFVDIGVGTDGLVHKSKMRGQDLMLGQKLEAKVLDIDRGRVRIGLEFLKFLSK